MIVTMKKKEVQKTKGILKIYLIGIKFKFKKNS